MRVKSATQEFDLDLVLERVLKELRKLGSLDEFNRGVLVTQLVQVIEGALQRDYTR